MLVLGKSYRIGPAISFYSLLPQKEKETCNPQLQILINSYFSVSWKDFAFFRGRHEWNIVTDAHSMHAQPSLHYLFWKGFPFNVLHLHTASKGHVSPGTRAVEKRQCAFHPHVLPLLTLCRSLNW